MCIEKGQFNLLVKLKKEKCQSLQNLVLLDQATDEQRETAKNAGLNLYEYTEVLDIGK